MDSAKRLYLYVVSAVSLFVLSMGLYNLVAVVLGELADALGANIIGGGGSVGREQISLAIALVAVGSPVFAVHWVLVGRGWRGSDDTARNDRHSAIRALHLGLVATVALALGVFAAIELLNYLFGTLLGTDPGGVRPTDSVALLLVATPVWWYHQRRRSIDLRHDRLSRAAAWITRLHRYAWALVGLMLLVGGLSQVIETLLSILIGREGFGDGADWWLVPLTSSLARVIVGAGLFWAHADDARRAIGDAGLIGEDDRASALRATYFGAVILVALSDVGVTVASSLAELGRWVLGVSEGIGTSAFLELVVGPPLVAIPFAIAGWLHWTAWRREAAGRSPEALAAAERLALHLTAAVGIIFLAVGTGQLLGRLFEVALGVAPDNDFLRFELAWFVAQIVVGVALWIPAWTLVMRRRLANPTTERQVTTGRAYLYLAVGAALIAAVPSAAFTLYRVVDTLLGGGGVALGSELSIPIAVVIVASLIALYHGRLLLSDLRSAQPSALVVAGPSAVVVVAEQPSAVAPAAVPGVSLALTLRGPAGADLESAADALREHLPADLVLEDR